MFHKECVRFYCFEDTNLKSERQYKMTHANYLKYLMYNRPQNPLSMSFIFSSVPQYL